ncbi:lysophospholipase L1-like esterase [Catalinimonas alkaloidigena]|uniref:GDSL-type esterase/lipase family protein n=1 Tax=Catalinimonas alkaloidigena TaxID=1075417 RepID=UPI002405438E|nr:GDSL-type esterase/lipase family protein [Catalinimonas alkaloidigena]MDF9796373.1 lysophospholipase L1-like esterase [Catalinimonas alkaloidigena]
MLLPLLLLVLFEIGLRWAGYGVNMDLFVEEARQPGFWVMNEHVSKKYFTQEENATIGNFEKFKKLKDEHTFRIFVLGESTTIGYPYMHNGSFHRWLQYRLMHTYPDTNFEVINLSLTAVNSYTVQDFAKQLHAQDPDLVLIYCGHNEYYGALGVGSTSYFGSHPSLIRTIIDLREFRLVQLLTNFVSKVRSSSLKSTVQPDLQENLMKRMALEQQISYDSDTYSKGIEQFESNLIETLNALEEYDIPVLISNLVSNEKDLAPFISDTTDSHFSANEQYIQAQEAYQQEDFAKAKALFIRAKALDMLRFRAPEEMNEIIRKQADSFPHVSLVDSKAVFEARSPHGILGQETLLEHVHPNLMGYALLSEAFYQSMVQQKLLPAESANEMTFETLRKQMPVTIVDSLKGAYEIMMLKEGWPFHEPITEEINVKRSFETQLAGGLSVKQIGWEEAMQQLYQYYLKAERVEDALKVSEALLLERPYQTDLYKQAAHLCMMVKDQNRSVFYLRKAFEQKAEFATAQSLFITLLKLDQPKEALSYLNFAVSEQPSNLSLSDLQMWVKQVIQLKDKYQQQPADVRLANQIAATYLKFANTSAAAIYVEKSLKLAQNNPTATALQEQIQAINN